MTDFSRASFNFRAAVTVLLGAAYVGSLIWALLHDRLDVQSFIAGIGPSFGLAMGAWFGTSRPGDRDAPAA